MNKSHRRNQWRLVSGRVWIPALIAFHCICAGFATCAADGTVKSPDHPAEVIRPGFGLRRCYIGMPIKQLGEGWRKIPSSMPDEKFSRTYLENPNLGLKVRHDGTQIVGVIIYFYATDSRPLVHQIEGVE